MFAVSARFLAAVTGSHGIATKARLVTTPGDTGADVAGRELAVLSGRVTLDAQADIRGRLDLTVAEPWPTSFEVDQLVPYGSEIAVWRGVEFGNGDVERVPLGIYRVDTVEQGEAPLGELTVTAYDRMKGIVDARLLSPVQYTAGTTNGDVVEDLVTAVYPAAVIEWDDASDAETLGRKLVVAEDRYAFLRDLAAGLGKVIYFDYRGVLVIRTPPDPAAPVLDVAAGAGGVLVSARRLLSREGVYNAVAATGEAVDDEPPAFGVAYDDDPGSPTYWDGPYGKVPRFYSSPFLTTDAKARAAARTVLLGNLGLPYAVDFSMVPNPALEPLDAVRVCYPPVLDGRSPAAARENHVLDTLVIGLGSSEAMAATTRLSRSPLIGES